MTEVDIVYDKNNKKVPSREFLSTLIILLRRCKLETGGSLTQFFEMFEELDEVDLYSDFELRRSIHKYLDDNYKSESKS